MDDRKLVVDDRWLQGPSSTSDYRAAYRVPCRRLGARIRPIYPCGACAGTGEDFNQGDPCDTCGGSGGLTAAAPGAPA